MTREKTYPAAVSISRPSYGNGDKFIEVTIRDRISGCQIVEVKIPLEAFAEALTGLSEVPAEASWRVKNLLKKHEVKQVKVPLIEGEDFPLGDARDDYAARACAPFEVDGWKASTKDFGNPHRSTGYKEGYNVTFHRYVEATPEDIEAEWERERERRQ